LGVMRVPNIGIVYRELAKLILEYKCVYCLIVDPSSICLGSLFIGLPRATRLDRGLTRRLIAKLPDGPRA
jgi:hypothetical protein